ncbi:hypothetical protein TIFTF001_052365 [Ficus carica]|uniref:Uncharacterized protein n=1 Tax=Ficus carica TaxID=3494 RepID=A0AA88EGM6_FICCA|nr:hypothetical protein TIFTF001_052365 [Ficus carica]
MPTITIPSTLCSPCSSSQFPSPPPPLAAAQS